MAKVIETQLEKWVITMTYCPNTYHNILFFKLPCVKKAYLCKKNAANHGGCFQFYSHTHISYQGPLLRDTDTTTRAEA